MAAPRPMPRRPRAHELETLSRRKFEMELGTWITRDHSTNDYGVDLRVEISNDGSMTGAEFAVQLKATEQIGRRAVAKGVKRSTLNYWDSLPVPTLLVLWDASTDRLHYEWSHRLAHDPNPTSKTRSLHLTQRWASDTLTQIEQEVSAWRALANLASDSRIDIWVHGDVFVGRDGGALRTELRRLLSEVPQFRVRHSSPTIPYIEVELTDSGALVGLSATVRRPLTWDPMPDPLPVVAIAADLSVAIAFAAGSRGPLREVAVSLLEKVTSTSHAILHPNVLPTVAANFTAKELIQPLTVVLRRALQNPDSQAADDAMTGYLAANEMASNDLIRAVAETIEASASRSAAPARLIYNAATQMRRVDPATALELYNRAAEALGSDYSSRGYWWRERGTVEAAAGNVDAALADYRRARQLGDLPATPLLANLLTLRGHYAKALELLEPLAMDRVEDAEDRLQRVRLRHFVRDWGLTEQERSTRPWAPASSADDEECLRHAELSIREDALNGWAHWQRCPPLERLSEPRFDALIAAAMGAKHVAQIWDDLVRAALAENRFDLVHDGLWCARSYCNDAFLDMLDTDDFVPVETRSAVRHLYESLATDPWPIELRDGSGILYPVTD